MTGSKRVICITFIHLHQIVTGLALACAHIRLSPAVPYGSRNASTHAVDPGRFCTTSAKSVLFNPISAAGCKLLKAEKRNFDYFFVGGFAPCLPLPCRGEGTIRERSAN